jgi:hypothetical protein
MPSRRLRGYLKAGARPIIALHSPGNSSCMPKILGITYIERSYRYLMATGMEMARTL